MSTKRMLFQQGKGLSFASILRPVRVVTEIDQKILENPSESDLKRYRNQGWKVVFEGIALAVGPNGSTRKCHFIRMEKMSPVSVALFTPIPAH